MMSAYKFGVFGLVSVVLFRLSGESGENVPFAVSAESCDTISGL